MKFYLSVKIDFILFLINANLQHNQIQTLIIEQNSNIYFFQKKLQNK